MRYWSNIKSGALATRQLIESLNRPAQECQAFWNAMRENLPFLQCRSCMAFWRSGVAFLVWRFSETFSKCCVAASTDGGAAKPASALGTRRRSGQCGFRSPGWPDRIFQHKHNIITHTNTNSQTNHTRMCAHTCAHPNTRAHAHTQTQTRKPNTRTHAHVRPRMRAHKQCNVLSACMCVCM